MEQTLANRKWVQKRDLIWLLLLGAFAVLLYCWPKEAGTAAVISQNGRELYTIDLTQVEEPYELSIPGECPVVIHVEQGAVWFAESACPDQICVRTGKLSQSGQSAVCLPAKVSVQISGSQQEYDAYTGV